MQLRWVSAAIIYLGSYLPLSLILLAQDLDAKATARGLCQIADMRYGNCSAPFKHPTFSLAAVALCAACLCASLFALRVLPTKHRVNVVESKHIPADLINYVIPYILSFISLDYGDPPKLIGFAVFLAWIYWITFKSGQIVLNPVLAVLGWKLFEVKYRHFGSEDAFTGRVLSKREIAPGKTYRQGGLQDVMIVSDVSGEGEE